MNRRHFIQGMAGILATATAPWVITKAGVLMPVKKIALPYDDGFTRADGALGGNWWNSIDDAAAESDSDLSVVALYKRASGCYVLVRPEGAPANAEKLGEWCGAIVTGDRIQLEQTAKDFGVKVRLNGVPIIDTFTK